MVKRGNGPGDSDLLFTTKATGESGTRLSGLFDGSFLIRLTGSDEKLWNMSTFCFCLHLQSPEMQVQQGSCFLDVSPYMLSYAQYV